MSNGRKVFTGGEPVVRDTGSGGGPGTPENGVPGETSSARRDTGRGVPGSGSLGAPRPSRRGVACSVRWTSGNAGRAGSAGGGSGAGGSGTGTGVTGVTSAAGVSTGDGSGIAWRVRTGGPASAAADVSGGTASRAATTGSTSGKSTGSPGGPLSEAVRCTAAPRGRGGPGCASGIGVSAGRTRSPMTPAGSAGPTR
ncbi:hypothetical protein ACFVYA_42025 [Amycolatopsis sp. NPDC058278]|uniref:hypothetical protein n=1 Tax=Amycolatopsis sp. NPDC058278 TaxID=3346417 RepID=UPI0036DA471F